MTESEMYLGQALEYVAGAIGAGAQAVTRLDVARRQGLTCEQARAAQFEQIESQLARMETSVCEARDAARAARKGGRAT